MKFRIVVLPLLLSVFSTFAQQSKPNLTEVDVLKYILSIDLNDSSDIINGEATIEVKLSGLIDKLNLNFVNRDDFKGMQVKSITGNGTELGFEHENNLLKIKFNENIINKVYKLKIKYQGVPKDGLIIGKNLYGNRTFFCDNWPNRAQNWFPCIDHPLDKALVEFKINVPEKYEVIANGMLKEEIVNADQSKLYHYETSYPIPTKVIVFGVADFSINAADTINNIPLSAWVYPQNKEKGVEKFNETADAFKFFSKKIGTYPFQKLASVQSSTIFGGMENAGNIFYPESRVAGNRSMDETVVHEVAHQWFGNCVTESDFSHLWLSEGFATYLTNLYFENKYGKAVLQKMLKEQREQVTYYYHRVKTPLVDSLNVNYMSMLNPNSYEKGAWVLHMLRKQVGDSLFWNILQEFYSRFKYSNASSNDFIKVAEGVSGRKLDDFIKQWLYQPGHPVINFDWKQEGNKLQLILEQQQKNISAYKFPLDLQIIYDDNTSEIISLEVEKRELVRLVKLNENKSIKKIIVDPNVWLLYEMN